ncbi:MAG TPA: hypothetical protein VMS64_30600 [Candidatus Methylomirabilis sp.]|nr:hypothetical protein [Candidatus Methylomirabilis sp.]
MVKTPCGERARRGAPVVTGMKCSAPIERVWNALMFYEQIPHRPPLHLRLLLPVPLRAEGPRSAVGDETRCVYEGGHVVKRATRVDRWRSYRFDVVEQNLAIGGGIRLVSGEYRLSELPGGTTRIELETCYVGSRSPAWLWRAVEAIVCHLFHRHILGAIRQDVESAQPRVDAIRSLR